MSMKSCISSRADRQKQTMVEELEEKIFGIYVYRYRA